MSEQIFCIHDGKTVLDAFRRKDDELVAAGKWHIALDESDFIFYADGRIVIDPYQNVFPGRVQHLRFHGKALNDIYKRLCAQITSKGGKSPSWHEVRFIFYTDGRITIQDIRQQVQQPVPTRQPQSAAPTATPTQTPTPQPRRRTPPAGSAENQPKKPPFDPFDESDWIYDDGADFEFEDELEDEFDFEYNPIVPSEPKLKAGINILTPEEWEERRRQEDEELMQMMIEAEEEEEEERRRQEEEEQFERDLKLMIGGDEEEEY